MKCEALQSNCTGLAGPNILHESAKLIQQKEAPSGMSQSRVSTALIYV